MSERTFIWPPRAGSLMSARARLDRPVSVAIVGGGLAGLAAAAVLGERGARVTVLERETFLGGRAGAWTDQLEGGESFEMERGFHAFFRQYYNLRALMRRVDPQLDLLEEQADYPILGPAGKQESFAGLPRRAPWNVIALTRRTPTIRLKDLLRINGLAATEMLRYERDRVYERFDDRTAKDYLDSLNFPPEARRMLFDVFAHSFFNPEETMSAAELLMMFHYYFVGNPEGLVFDTAKRPFSHGLFEPLAAHLESHGAEIRRETTVASIERRGEVWRVHLEGADTIDAEHVVLAVTVPALQAIHAGSPDLQADADWNRKVDSLSVTNPFAVWRLWLDRPCAPDRVPFAGTTGVGQLDNISVYEHLEDESRAWADRTGGSVVELHAYGVAPSMGEEELREDLMAALHTFYPETREARVLEERWILRRDCPSFEMRSDALRPTVDTPHEGLTLAGDFARLPFPSALMERAVSSGFMAANDTLATHGVRPEVLHTIPLRGPLAGRRARRPAAATMSAGS